MTVRPSRASRVTADAGQALVEFAIALPFVLLLLAGSIDFGRYMYDGIELANGARAGAQYGSQDHVTEHDVPGMIAAATKDAQAISGAVGSALYCQCGFGSTATCDTTSFAYTCPTDHPVDYVNVQLTATFTPMIALPGLPSSLTIKRNALAQVSP